MEFPENGAGMNSTRTQNSGTFHETPRLKKLVSALAVFALLVVTAMTEIAEAKNQRAAPPNQNQTATQRTRPIPPRRSGGSRPAPRPRHSPDPFSGLDMPNNDDPLGGIPLEDPNTTPNQSRARGRGGRRR